MNNRFIVYCIFNTNNGKIYIGKTNNSHKRWLEHISTSKKNESKNYSLIHRAIKKYGYNSFVYGIIQEVNSDDEACCAEKYWIKYYITNVIRYGDEYGYNLTDGGEGTQLFGENNPRSKLLEKQIINIKTSDLPTGELAEKYKVNRTTIQRIRRNSNWKLVKVENAPSKSEVIDFFYKGRKGENCPSSKLTWNIVDQIRLDYANDQLSISELSRKYNTSWTNIKYIIKNETWKR